MEDLKTVNIRELLEEDPSVEKISELIDRTIKLGFSLELGPEGVDALRKRLHGAAAALLSNSVDKSFSIKALSFLLETYFETIADLYNPADVQRRQAWIAREKKPIKPENVALAEAIVATRGSGPVPHPTKEATAIHSQVNRIMVRKKLPRVHVDKIRRRLEKFPRS